EYSCME
ncbi:unnamed protein product, partial [Onchocerca ochengi]